MFKLQDLQGNAFFEFHSFADIDFDKWCLNEAFRVGIDKAFIFDDAVRPLINDLHSFEVRENIKEYASAYPDEMDFVICDDGFISIFSQDLLDYIKEALRID